MAHHDDARLAEVVSEIVGDADTKAVVRRLLQRALQELIETELTATIGAAPHERTEARSNQRNGGRAKTRSTPSGDVQLRIPKVKTGSFSVAVGAAPAGRPSAVGGDHDHLHPRDLHAQCR